MFESGLLIANQTRSAENGAVFTRENPATRLDASRAAAASLADIEAAADAAAAAFPDWAAAGPTARRLCLMRAADALEQRLEAIAERMAAETGATASWAAVNVRLGARILREAAALTTHVKGEIIPSDEEEALALGLRQPVGVVVGIAPWNAPVILGVRAIAAPLACGNTVVLKASELCPATHHIVGEAICAGGFPSGVVNVVSNAPDDAPGIVEALVAHPAVRRINFTGSTRVGRIVAETAARHLKPVLLELGGKAPFVVLSDADLEAAAEAAAFGAFMNQGQICMSTERIVVEESVADSFVDRLAAIGAALRAGDPRREDAVLGSLVSADAAARVEALVVDACAKGGVLRAGGSREGPVMQPTVIDHVTSTMRLYHEESFGPVVGVVRVCGEDEAVRVANDTEYGLSSAVWSRDVQRALHVAERLESGICQINGATVDDEAQMPFGGMKASGYGRFGGTAAIHEFTELRWVTLRGGRRDYRF